MKKLISRFLVALSAFVPNNCSLAMDELTLNMLYNKELLKQKTERFEGFGWEKIFNLDIIDLKKVRRIGTKKEVEAILDEYKEKFCQGIIKECKKLDAQNQNNKEKIEGKVQLFHPHMLSENDLDVLTLMRVCNQFKKNHRIQERPASIPFLIWVVQTLARSDNCVVCRNLVSQLYKEFYDKGLLSCAAFTGFPIHDHMVFLVPYIDGGILKHWVADPMAIKELLTIKCNEIMKDRIGLLHSGKVDEHEISTLQDILNLKPDNERYLLNILNKVAGIPKQYEVKALTDLMKMPLENYRQWGHHENMMIYGLDPENEYVHFGSFEAGEIAAYEQDPTLNPYSVQRYFNSIKKIQGLDGKVKYKTRNYSVENKQKKVI